MKNDTMPDEVYATHHYLDINGQRIGIYFEKRDGDTIAAPGLAHKYHHHTKHQAALDALKMAREALEAVTINSHRQSEKEAYEMGQKAIAAIDKVVGYNTTKEDEG